MGHLGARASALLDGQLSAVEEERAWSHVHLCHVCRDAVEREGWVKTRLRGLSFGEGAAPDDLKGSLLGAPRGAAAGSPSWSMPPGDLYLVMAQQTAPRRSALGIAALGGGAVGAALMGVLALGAAPADAPGLDRRAPVTSVGNATPAPLATSNNRRPTVPTP